MGSRRMRNLQTRDRAGGFTLLELSVVVLVVTLLIGGLLVPLSTQVEQRNISDTQQRLAQIHDALIGFAIAHGRFPCPATVSSPPQPTDLGVEDPPTGTGVCTHPIDGYVRGGHSTEARKFDSAAAPRPQIADAVPIQPLAAYTEAPEGIERPRQCAASLQQKESADADTGGTCGKEDAGATHAASVPPTRAQLDEV
jgi:type II secretory pathway pseudopilin PulG